MGLSRAHSYAKADPAKLLLLNKMPGKTGLPKFAVYVSMPT